MKKIFISTLLLAYSYSFKAQIVKIPDVSLKQKLLTHSPKIDTNNDGEISIQEASAIVNTLDISDANIDDITGLEAFINVEEIQMYYNNGSVKSISFENNAALKRLYLEGSNLEQIDISKNKALEILNCNENNLSILDIEHNSNLRILECGLNNLQTLDTSKNPLLEELLFYDNEVSALDLSKNNHLTSIYGYGNRLRVLDITQNPSLVLVDLENNSIERLDASKNTKLVKLILKSNQLTELDISFGDYRDFSELNIEQNPNLSCVKITKGMSPSPTWRQDVAVSYNETCGTMSTTEFVEYTSNIEIYPNPVADTLYVQTNKKVREIKILDLVGRVVLSNFNQNNMSLKTLDKGVYIVQVVLEGQTIAKKIVKK